MAREPKIWTETLIGSPGARPRCDAMAVRPRLVIPVRCSKPSVVAVHKPTGISYACEIHSPEAIARRERLGKESGLRSAERSMAIGALREHASAAVKIWKSGPLYSSPEFAAAMGALSRTLKRLEQI